MSKTTTAILSIIALIVGFVLYYTGLLNPVFAWLNANVWLHITNFFGFLKANPIASTALGSLSGGGVLAVAKSVYTGQKNTAVAEVTSQSQTQINSIGNQLFQANNAVTESEKTIATLQAQITELKAQKPDDSALFESQQLVIAKQQELERLRSDYNALVRIKAEQDLHPKEVVIVK